VRTIENDVEFVVGGGALGDAAAGLGIAATVGGGLAAVPTPASPALAGFAVVAGVLAGALAWADTKVSQ